MHQCDQLTSRHQLTHTQPKSNLRALTCPQLSQHIPQDTLLLTQQSCRTDTVMCIYTARYLLLPNYCNAVLEQQTACIKKNTAFLLNLFIHNSKKAERVKRRHRQGHSLCTQVTRSSFFLSENFSKHAKDTAGNDLHLCFTTIHHVYTEHKQVSVIFHILPKYLG